MDSTLCTFHLGLRLRDRRLRLITRNSQEIHKKLLENTKLLTNLHKRLNATVKLLNGVTC